MSVVRIEGVTKHYGSVVAVNRLDLEIAEGEFVTLLGPSGCGKTTTLRMIAGFVIPTSGVIEIAGRDVTRVPPHKRPVGLVFQNYALFPHMTVSENVGFGLRMRGVGRDERSHRVLEALKLVRMEDLGERFPGQLSGGQQQRVALARALVIRPDILLLDEPFGALDKQLRDHMRVELRSLQQELGISTVFVTHDQDEAMSMSDRICVMSQGLAQQIGPPLEIYDHPATRFVADFMGRSNLLDATVTAKKRGGAAIDLQGVAVESASPAEPGASVTAMIRPERIAVRPAAARPKAGEHAGRIVRAVHLGAVVEHEVEIEGGPRLLAMRTHAGAGGAPLEPGAPVLVSIPRDAVYLLRE